MRRQRWLGSLAGACSRWWQAAQLPTVGAGLLLIELLLVGGLGPPATQLRVLGDLGEAWADPVGSVLALLALCAEALVAYLFAVLSLSSLSLLPGMVGRLAARMALLVTPVAVRRALDVLVGGTLLIQATLAAAAAATPGPRVVLAHTGLAVSTRAGPAGPATARPGVAPLVGPASGSAVAGPEPVDTRPTARRSPVPLPPWLGGGPSNLPGSGRRAPTTTTDPASSPPDTDRAEPDRADARPGGPGAGGGSAQGRVAGPPGPRPDVRGLGPDPVSPPGGGKEADEHVVRSGETLWAIAAAHLMPTERSVANIHRYWQQVYRANQAVIGPDPDLIHPGMRLEVPPYRGPRR